MTAISADVQYTFRMWLRNPGFTTVAVITLALGIGANSTMFSIVNSTLLRPLPFPAPEKLVTLWKGPVDNPEQLNIVSMPNFRDWQARSQSLASAAIFDSAGRGYSLSGGSEPEQVSGVRVTASFFAVLGVEPMLGRTFLPEEEDPGRDEVVVLSHGLWTRRYSADPGIVGRAILIDGRNYTVVGVMPPQFKFQFGGGMRQLWVPAGWTKGDYGRGSNSFIAIGRLRDDVSVEQARSEMDTIGRAMALAFPDENGGQTIRVVPMSEIGVTRLQPTLVAMLAVVGFVLLIACVNVANLMLARAAARAREFAVRAALGAGRGRIVRQLLTESVLLASAGAAGGLLIAYWGTRAIFPLLPPNMRFIPLRPVEQIDIDGTVLAFTSLVAVASGVLFGLAPALTFARRDVNDTLKENARTGTGGRSRLRYALVASEVALTLVVLAGAGVMLLSVSRLLAVEPGLETTNVLALQMSVPQENLYYGPPGNPQFCEALDRQVAAVPGVLSASAIAHLPLSGANAGRAFSVDGKPDPGPRNQPGAAYTVACPNVLRTLGIGLMSGREFTFQDTLEAPSVAIVNEDMAKRHWPGEDAVGKRFTMGVGGRNLVSVTIVGVFNNVRRGSLDSAPGPWFIRPYTQAAWPFMSVVVRTSSAPAPFVEPIKRALQMVQPNQAVSNVRTMEQVVAGSVSSRRFPMLLLSLFGLLALTLAAVGIAGVVGYSVVQRTQEIGLRMALGAQKRDVLRLVLGQSLTWTLGGIGMGLAAAFGVLRLLGSLLYDVKPADPLVLAGVSGLLVLVALGASYMPARRAMRVDAATTLRS